MNNSNGKQNIVFSRHAKNRMTSRQIDITEDKLRLLKEAIEKALEKGAKNSLIIINDTAFVVSVENYTVITIIDQENIKEKVFTNIDSAVLM